MSLVLIVDADASNAQIAANAFINAGIACGIVTSAEHAFQVLKTRRPDAILVEMELPLMNGCEMLRKLRNSPKQRDLPVIMFSKNVGDDEEAQERFAGATGYIRKPIQPEKLVRKIQEVLQTRTLCSHKKLEDLLKESAGTGGHLVPNIPRLV